MSQSIQGKVGSKARWLALLAVTSAFSFTFLSRYTWSPLMLSVSQEFNLSAAQAGLYMSAFFAGYLITQIPSGIMADRLQPKYIIIICTVISGLMTAAMASIPSYEMGLLFRVIGGVSSGCIMASCSKVVAMNFALQDRASAMGILLASPPIGITLANMIGPVLNQRLGWRGTFTVVGAMASIVVILTLLFVKPVPRSTQPQGGGGLLSGLKGYFSDKNQWILGVSGFMFMAVSVGFATWCNTYAQKELGLLPAQGGMVITCYSIAGIIGSCLSGSICKKLGLSHKKFLLLTLGGMAVFTILFSMQKSYTGLLLVGIIYGFIGYLPSTHYTTLCMTMAHESYAATAVSSQNLIFQMASMIQPAIIGGMLDATGNYSMIWYAFTGCLIIGILFCGLFPAVPVKGASAAKEPLSLQKGQS